MWIFFVQNLISNFLRYPEEVHMNAQSSQGFDQDCLLNSTRPQPRFGLQESDLITQYHAVHGLEVASSKSFIHIISILILYIISIYQIYMNFIIIIIIIIIISPSDPTWCPAGNR